jgi:pimeloyl-ACP methyl ester carboxylesterase
MSAHIEIDGLRVEVEDLEGTANGPALVFLHEGLGSVELWRGVPAEVAAATGRRTVTFSRFGHGDSDAPLQPRTPAFFHTEALEVLPALLAALGIERPVLVGHSDGASIALIHASEHPVTAVAVLAPHVFVEEICLQSIREIRAVYEQGELRERMARRHRDPDAAFYGWNDVWLDPAFPAWSIEDVLPRIAVPVLAIQGRDDEYGTLEQIHRISAAVHGPARELVVGGGHSPHLERREEVVAALVDFVASVRP